MNTKKLIKYKGKKENVRKEEGNKEGWQDHWGKELIQKIENEKIMLIT